MKVLKRLDADLQVLIEQIREAGEPTQADSPLDRSARQHGGGILG